MATAFAALGADHVGADVEAFLNVLGVPDHVHVEDAGFVEALDDGFGGDADGGDEEAGAGVDDDGYEIVEFAFGVVVALEGGLSAFDLGVPIPLPRYPAQKGIAYFVFLALPPTCGIRRSTPKGAFLSVRKPFSSAICSRSMSGV